MWGEDSRVHVYGAWEDSIAKLYGVERLMRPYLGRVGICQGPSDAASEVVRDCRVMF